MQQTFSSKLTQIAIATACAALLAACGGGDGSTAGDNNQENTQQPGNSGGNTGTGDGSGNGGSNAGNTGGGAIAGDGQSAVNISGTPATPQKNLATAMSWVFIDSVARGVFNANFGSNEPGKDYQVAVEGKGILNHSFDGTRYTWTATTGRAFWRSEAFISCSGFGPKAATIAIPALQTEPIQNWKELADTADYVSLKGKKFRGYGCGSASEIEGDAFFQVNSDLSATSSLFPANNNISITDTNSLFSGGLNTRNGSVQLAAIKTQSGYLIAYARTNNAEREIRLLVEEK